jgi:hypothetical protein
VLHVPAKGSEATPFLRPGVDLEREGAPFDWNNNMGVGGSGGTTLTWRSYQISCGEWRTTLRTEQRHEEVLVLARYPGEWSVLSPNFCGVKLREVDAARVIAKRL